MLNCYMCHHLMHRAECLVAGFFRFGHGRVYPQAGVLLLDRGPHIPEEGPGPVGHVHVIKLVHWVHVIHVHVEMRVKVLGTRARDLRVLVSCSPGVEVGGSGDP